MFPLWEGYYQRTQVVVSACEGDENVHAANVRHLAQFYRLSAAFLVEPVTAVREDLKPFDAVVGQEARHYFCPTALIGDMDLPDELIFRGREMNEWLAAPSVWAESSLVALLEKHWQSSAASAGIGPIKRVVVGTSSRPLRGWRFGEFVRVRFGVDVADAGGYGFLESCRDVGVPGAIVGVVTRDCSCHP
ncbi:MAG: hypothetical protein N2Z21_11050, partial [Candidatus Sumerlaeaceae bacterium]|nr:hypothetical protein [Candidatus Sumerlaeaceae bacterium]